MRLPRAAASAKTGATFAIALLALANAAVAQSSETRQPAASPPHLRGLVLDKTSHDPVVSAQVVLDADGRVVSSDSTGAYDIADVPAGAVALTVHAPGFAVAHYVVRLLGSGDWKQDFELDSTKAAARTVAQLAPVKVTAQAPDFDYRLRDFEIRRASGRGQYLTDEQIQASGAANIQDAVRTMRGVLLDCAGTVFAECRIRMARAPERCMPEYYIDGQLDNYFGPKTPIRDVVGIEVYTGPSDVPGEFAGTNAGCGVVVLWTRSGPKRKRSVKEH